MKTLRWGNTLIYFRILLRYLKIPNAVEVDTDPSGFKHTGLQKGGVKALE